MKYRDLDYDTAKKEVIVYFQERGEAYPSEVEEDLELDYELVCQITEGAEARGPPGAAKTDCYEAWDALARLSKSGQRPARSAIPAS